jgi:hypothetical protein
VTSSSKIAIVQIPKILLLVCRAEADSPDEIKAAWQTLESKLSTLKGRKFYGLSYSNASGSAYFAAVQPLDAEEGVALGFPSLLLKGGKHARVKLMDWPEHTEEIPAIFDQLERAVSRDPTRPSLEFYRSQSELHLLVPLVDNEA